MSPSPGRPCRASKALLQEAAFELFQLRGYRATTVELIARTAGFSRATFFTLFSSKAELFWVETDALIDALRASLARETASGRPRPLRDAILHHAGSVTTADIPWALQYIGLLGADDDLIASGASRVRRLSGLLQAYEEDRDPGADPTVRAARAAAVTGALLVGVRAWIAEGVERGALRERLADCLPVGV